MPDPFSAAWVANVEANRTIKDELRAAASSSSRRRRISVTDLVNVRQAYFQRRHPEIKIPLDRREAMWQGTGFHELFGRAVSTEEFVEQFVEADGVVGKIDIYDRAPVELKTSGSMPRELRERPSYVDQLGMYCALVDRPRGQLIVCRRAEYGRPAALAVYWLAFRDLDAVRRAMAARRDLLAHALESGDPGALPRCDWFVRGCDYKSVCGCGSAPLPAGRVIPEEGYVVTEDPGAARRYLELLSQTPPAGDFKLNDLVFPRRALLQRRDGVAEDPEERMGSMQRFGFQIALDEALRYGVPGAFKGMLVRLGALRGLVRTYRDAPTILRVIKRRQMVDRHRLPADQPHYFDRLAFECALSGHEKGRLIVYYSEIESDDEKFMVYDVHFRDLPEIRAEAERRLALLERGATVEELPPCPAEWMPGKYCPFKDRCACLGARAAQADPAWPF